MYTYIDFLRDGSKKTPSWAWLMTGAWGAISTFPYFFDPVKSVIAHYWFWWAIFILIFVFLALTQGMFKHFQNREAAHLTQIEALKDAGVKEWGEKTKAASDLQDERDIPNVIKELKEERGKWMRAENMDWMSARETAPDENYFVARLKGKRDERLVRKTYKLWKADKFN
jgi:hypothetical protein